MKKIGIFSLAIVLIIVLTGCESKSARKERERKEKMIGDMYYALIDACDRIEGINKLSTDSLRYEDYKSMTETMGFIELRCEELLFDLNRTIDEYSLDLEGY